MTSKHRGRWLSLMGAVLKWSVQEETAFACAACSCGDPTLTTMGTEQAFAGRLRLSSELRYRGLETGTRGANAVVLQESRIEFGLTYAPTAWLLLSATVPVVYHNVQYVNLARDRVFGLGDADLRAKAFLFRDRAFSPRHLLAGLAGLTLPTAPELMDASGASLNHDAQPGNGAFVPQLGLSYAHIRRPWSFFGSSLLSFPAQGRDAHALGGMLRSGVSVQYQPGLLLAARLGIDSRVDGISRSDGVAEADSGGLIAFASADVIFSPLEDLTFRLGGAIPILNYLTGEQQESAIGMLGVMYDF